MYPTTSMPSDMLACTPPVSSVTRGQPSSGSGGFAPSALSAEARLACAQEEHGLDKRKREGEARQKFALEVLARARAAVSLSPIPVIGSIACCDQRLSCSTRGFIEPHID